MNRLRKYSQKIIEFFKRLLFRKKVRMQHSSREDIKKKFDDDIVQEVAPKILEDFSNSIIYRESYVREMEETIDIWKKCCLMNPVCKEAGFDKVLEEIAKNYLTSYVFIEHHRFRYGFDIEESLIDVLFTLLENESLERLKKKFKSNKKLRKILKNFVKKRLKKFLRESFHYLSEEGRKMLKKKEGKYVDKITNYIIENLDSPSLKHYERTYSASALRRVIEKLISIRYDTPFKREIVDIFRKMKPIFNESYRRVEGEDELNIGKYVENYPYMQEYAIIHSWENIIKEDSGESTLELKDLYVIVLVDVSGSIGGYRRIFEEFVQGIIEGLLLGPASEDWRVHVVLKTYSSHSLTYKLEKKKFERVNVIEELNKLARVFSIPQMDTIFPKVRDDVDEIYEKILKNKRNSLFVYIHISDMVLGNPEFYLDEISYTIDKFRNLKKIMGERLNTRFYTLFLKPSPGIRPYPDLDGKTVTELKIMDYRIPQYLIKQAFIEISKDIVESSQMQYVNIM